MSSRWVKFGAVGLGLLVAAGVATAAFMSLRPALQSPGASSPVPALACTPAPCASLQGYTLWVSNLTVTGNLVSMQLVFKNASDSTHASPEDLQLVDSKQHASGLVVDSPGCTTWDRHVFNGGAQFGPVSVCFRTTSTDTPLILRWSPDFGLLCCQTEIKLS